MQCPICKASLGVEIKLCRCGYDISKNEIAETGALKSFYLNLKINSHWAERIKLTKTLHDFQQSLKGKTFYGKRGGWGYRETAALLGVKPSIISDDLKLAAYLEEYDEIKNSKNRKQALDKIPNVKSGMISINFAFYDSEERLQKYLENSWNETPFSQHWDLKESFSRAGDAGEIDLLARHKVNKSWLIIELKRKEAPDKTVGQLLRYMGWFKKSRADAGVDEDVLGIIISGYPPDPKLMHAIAGTSGVDLWIYYRLGEETFFINEEKTFELLEFERQPQSEQEKLLESVRGKK
jgi:hypothetical protein